MATATPVCRAVYILCVQEDWALALGKPEEQQEECRRCMCACVCLATKQAFCSSFLQRKRFVDVAEMEELCQIYR